MRMDPDRARELAQRGAALLLLGVPAGTRVGLDHQSFVVAEGFRGFKMVPPGPHYLSYNAASRAGEFSPTVAVLAHLASRQVLVRRWSPCEELLLPLEDEDEEERFAAGVRRFDFDSGLAPYALDTYAQWQALTPHVTAATVDRLAPAHGNVSVTAEADPALERRPPTQAEVALEQQLSDRPQGGNEEPQSGRSSKHVGRCHYTPLPRLQKGAGLTAAELTAQNLDKSALLESVLQQHCSGDPGQLLGEFEMAFAAFLFGQSLEGFSQWKEVLQLALGSEAAALGSRAGFFTDLLRVLQVQLMQGLGKAPQGSGSSRPSRDADSDIGAMIEELLPASFLRQSVGGFLEMLAENASSAPPQLRAEADSLRQLLQQLLGINFDITELASDDEDAPVVVAA